MNIIFMGTPEFAETILNTLADKHHVAAVVTQPDKPVGRGHKMRTPPVKRLALSLNIPVLQPEKLRPRSFYDTLESYKPDVIVVAAYGKILPKHILDLPPSGCVNVHASLLPKYRGAAPVQWAIINGETETGITIMYMDEGVDTGGMILKTRTIIEPGDTYGSLRDRLAIIGSEALIEALRQIDNKTVCVEEQNEADFTYAPLITDGICKIDWNKSGVQIINLIRALNPEPGAVSSFDNMKIWKAELFRDDQPHKNALPGEIICMDKRGPAVKTADGAVLVTELQARGGKKMPAADYLRGHNLPVGLKL